MKINLTKLLDISSRIKHINYNPENTTDGFYYVNKVERTSPDQAYSFELETDELK